MIRAPESLADLIPAYNYWPVANPSELARPDLFADGGSFEHSGVNGMLSYSDIDFIIALVNASAPLAAVSPGVRKADGTCYPQSGYWVDDMIPPLFGYQPYQEGVGYVAYQGATEIANLKVAFSRSKIFDSAEFVALLRGLWHAANGDSTSATNAQPAMFQQTLQVQANSWFGIPGAQCESRGHRRLGPSESSQDVGGQIVTESPGDNGQVGSGFSLLPHPQDSAIEERSESPGQSDGVVGRSERAGFHEPL